MIYRNTQTGAVIETSAKVSGGSWEEVKPPSSASNAPAQKKKPPGGKSKRTQK